MDLDDAQEEVPIYDVASQQYSHEYSGDIRQKYFNDNVHGRAQGSRRSPPICTAVAQFKCQPCLIAGRAFQGSFHCTEQVWQS